MFTQNGFVEKKYTPPYPVALPSTIRIQQTVDEKMFTKNDFKELVAICNPKGAIRNLVTINDKREDELKTNLKEQKQRIDLLETCLKQSEEKRIRHEEEIKHLSAKNKELTGYCKKEKEKREKAQQEKSETEAMMISMIGNAKEMELKNKNLQKELDEAKEARTFSSNDEKDEMVAKLTEQNQTLYAELQTKTDGIQLVGQRLKDRNKQLAEIKKNHEIEMEQVRKDLTDEFMAQTERIRRQYELQIQQYELQIQQLKSNYRINKNQDINQLGGALQNLRTGSRINKHQSYYFNGACTSFGQLAATPAGQKRPPFTPYSLPDPSRRSLSCGRSRSSAHTRRVDFELEDEESPQQSLPNPANKHENPVLIDLTGEDKRATPNKFNISGVSSNSASKSVQTDSSKGPSEKFEDIYEVVDHTTSLPQTPNRANSLPPRSRKLKRKRRESIDAELDRHEELKTTMYREIQEQNLEQDLNFDNLPGNVSITAEEEMALLGK